MKKLAILIATLLIVCLMACACGSNSGSSASTQTPDSSSTTTSSQAGGNVSTGNGGTSSTTTTSSANGSSTVTPSVTGTLINFADSQFSSLSGTLSADTTIGALTIGEGAVYKTGLNNSIDGITFTCAIQLGKNGSYARKNIKFTATTAGTVEIYTKGGNSSTTSYTINYGTSATNAQSITVGYDKGKYTLTIPSAGTYAIWLASSESSVNIMGIKINC